MKNIIYRVLDIMPSYNSAMICALEKYVKSGRKYSIENKRCRFFYRNSGNRYTKHENFITRYI